MKFTYGKATNLKGPWTVMEGSGTIHSCKQFSSLMLKYILSLSACMNEQLTVFVTHEEAELFVQVNGS